MRLISQTLVPQERILKNVDLDKLRMNEKKNSMMKKNGLNLFF